MNRRGFLGLLGGATAAALIGELPSSKTFFLPPAGGWRPDQAKVDAAFRAWVDGLTKSMLHTKEQVMATVFNDAQFRGIGYAVIKPEGGSIAYDPVEIRLSFGKQGAINGEIISEGKARPAIVSICRPRPEFPDHGPGPRESGFGFDRTRTTGRTA